MRPELRLHILYAATKFQEGKQIVQEDKETLHKNVGNTHQINQGK